MDKTTRPERNRPADATGQGPTPDPEPKVGGMRRGAYTFLRQRAGLCWTLRGPDGEPLDIATPPELMRQRDFDKRMRQHARQEAERVKASVPFQVSAALTADAVLLGAKIAEVGHAAAMELAGKNTVDSIGITPPSTSGFLLWDDPEGIGYSATGSPLIACHWGPLAKRAGVWLAWWCDSRRWLAHYKAGYNTDGAPSPLTWGEFSTTFYATTGPLWCDRQNLLSPLGANPELAEEPVADADDVEWEPGEREAVALMHTTIATWELLGAPGAAALRLVPTYAALDRRAGVVPASVVVASLPGEVVAAG
jgi:hypothetical protein